MFSIMQIVLVRFCIVVKYHSFTYFFSTNVLSKMFCKTPKKNLNREDFHSKMFLAQNCEVFKRQEMLFWCFFKVQRWSCRE